MKGVGDPPATQYCWWKLPQRTPPAEQLGTRGESTRKRRKVVSVTCKHADLDLRPRVVQIYAQTKQESHPIEATQVHPEARDPGTRAGSVQFVML